MAGWGGPREHDSRGRFVGLAGGAVDRGYAGRDEGDRAVLAGAVPKRAGVVFAEPQVSQSVCRFFCAVEERG